MQVQVYIFVFIVKWSHLLLDEFVISLNKNLCTSERWQDYERIICNRKREHEKNWPGHKCFRVQDNRCRLIMMIMKCIYKLTRLNIWNRIRNCCAFNHISDRSTDKAVEQSLTVFRTR